MNRVYNFSAGPSMLPVPVLQKAQADLLDYHGSGMSVMEMSHRSKWFDEIIQNTEAGIRKVLNVPDNYKIGFFQGGATQQFAMVPLNFMTTGKADYIVTGNFSNLAAKEAAKAPAVQPAAPVQQAAAAPAPQVEEGIPGDVVAAIMAAIHAMGNGKYTLKAVRRSKNGWGNAGVNDTTAPF